MDFTPIYTSLELAFLVVLILLIICVPLAYVLAFSKSKWIILPESILMLPIVMPPTVMGFYFLVALGPETSIGGFFEEHFGLSFAFSFEGIVLASVLYCLPFMLSPLISAFRSLPKTMSDLVLVLGKSKREALWKVFLPAIRVQVLGAIVITFAHVMGQFGLILMVGGKMEGTRVASVAIYDEMNLMNMDAANNYALLLLITSFVMIVFVTWLSRKQNAEL